MQTGIQEKSEIVLTPQEAEAVLELWARTQAEGEIRSRLNVQDLAEATGLSASEIEQMVATIRMGKPSQANTPPVPKAKPVNYALIAVAVLVWIAILAAVGTIAYNTGRASTIVVEAPLPPEGIPMPTAAAIAEPSEMMAPTPAPGFGPGSSLNEFTSVEFEGYRVKGESAHRPSESDVVRALERIIAQVEPGPSLVSDTEYSSSLIINALEADDSKLVGGQIRFLPMTVSVEGASKTVSIPIARVSNSAIVSAVERERAKRLRILANWTLNPVSEQK